MLKYFFWTAFEKLGSQIINLLVQILLARILAPEIFGLIALIQIFIAVAQVIVEAGIGNYIIQKKELYKSDISTSLVINLFLSIIIYLILFFTAPIISGFYNQIILIDVLRIYSFAFIFQSLYVTNQAIFQRNLKFKSIAYISLVSSIISAILSIFFVYFYKSVYILVLQQLVFHLVKAVLFTYYGSENILFKFSKESFQSIYKYSSYLLLIGILNQIFDYSYLIVIGKLFKIEQAGFYHVSFMLVGFVMVTISLIVEKVSFPILSKLFHTSIIKFKEKLFLFSNLSILLITTSSFIFSVYSFEILSLIYGEKWIDASVMFSYISLGFLVFPISIMSITIFKIKGNTNTYFYTSIFSKLLIIVSILLTYKSSIENILIAQIIVAFLSSLIFTSFACKSISISLNEFIFNHLNITLLLISYVIVQLFIKQFLDIFFILEIIISILITYYLNTFMKMYDFKKLISQISNFNLKIIK